MTVRECHGRILDQGGGGGGGVGTEGEPELRMLGAKGEPTAWTVGGAEGKPTKFGAGGGGDGVGIEGEPELRTLGTKGEPTAWTVGGAEGKPAKVWCLRWWGWSWHRR